MILIEARNIHTAAVPALMAMRSDRVEAPGSWVVPQPITLTLARPYERLPTPALGINPFHLFFEGLAALSPSPISEIDGNLVTAGGLAGAQLPAIVEALSAEAASIPLLTSPNQQAHVVRTPAGAIDLFVASFNADLAYDVLGFGTVRLSFVQEMIGAALRLPVGVLRHVATNARQDPLLSDVPPDVPFPPGTPGPVPLVGLPLGRWFRELTTLLRRGPDGPPGDDYWLEGVARPLWLAWRASQSPTADAIGSAQEIVRGCADASWGSAAYAWLEAQRERPEEEWIHGGGS